MKLEVNIQDIINDPIVEHTICSFGSITKGVGRLNVLTNIVTKEISFKVISNAEETITDNLAEAVALYNLIGL